MSASGNEKKSSDGRWWEFYFVRYFIGSVVGGAILFYLNSSKMSILYSLIIPGVTDLSKLNAPFLSLLAALGLAYCYVASAPVLVLHVTRGVWLAENANKTFAWCIFFAFIFFSVVVAFVFFATKTVPDIKSALSIFLFVYVLSLQCISLFLALRKNGESIHLYYTKITKGRSNDTEEARQYVESFRHLREHGNAFLIILFDLVLGMILATVPKINIAIIALLLWTLPAAFVWIIGNVMEYRFSN